MSSLALAKLNEALFDNSDKIPEGLYLELMNITKEIFNERPQDIVRWKTLIKYREMEKHRISKIIVNPRPLYTRKNIHIVGESNIVVGTIMEGGYMELLAFGLDKVFLQVIKINKCSIKCEKHIFRRRLDVMAEEYSYEAQDGTIKIAIKYEPNDSGVLYISILPKDIIVYRIPQAETKERYDECVAKTTIPDLPVDF